MKSSGKEKFHFYYIFNTIRGYSAFFLVLLIIFLLSVPYFLLSLTFDRKKNIYRVTIYVLVRFFWLLNWKWWPRMVSGVPLKAPVKGERRIYVINHQSLLDGLLMFLLPGDIRFMASQLYTNIPVFGAGVEFLGNIAVKRDEQGAPLDIYYGAKEILGNGYPLVIFPEGHRSRTSRLERFQNSAFMLALEEKADIVPVVFDSWNVLRPGGFLIRKVDVGVRILDPIPYESFKNDHYKKVSNRVRAVILKEILTVYENKKNQNKNYYRHHSKFTAIDEEMKQELVRLEAKLASGDSGAEEDKR
jgi:1-acyl-sn-glycerol-3-phosphate acyltransferase